MHDISLDMNQQQPESGPKRHQKNLSSSLTPKGAQPPHTAEWEGQGHTLHMSPLEGEATPLLDPPTAAAKEADQEGEREEEEEEDGSEKGEGLDPEHGEFSPGSLDGAEDKDEDAHAQQGHLPLEELEEPVPLTDTISHGLVAMEQRKQNLLEKVSGH
jgi:hypothetical protein